MNDVPPTSESRLDALVGALRQAEPTLDEVTRARVGADLQSALRSPPPARPSFFARVSGLRSLARRDSSSRTRWLAGGFALAAAAALILVWRSVSAPSPPAAPSTRAAMPPPASAAALPAAPAVPALSPGRTVDIAAGSTARVAIADADITVYGPGRIAAPSNDPITTLDADAALIDRSHGDGSLTLRYASLEVHVTHATFALDRKLAPRVTVMRGELLLRCPTTSRTIRAGESATCTNAAPATSPSPTGDLAGDPFDRAAAAGTRADRTTSGSRGARAPARTSASRGDLGGNPFEGGAGEPRPSTGATADPYAMAEAALRSGDRAAARTALEKLVAGAPASTDAAAALLDLARLDASTDRAAALRHLDALEAHPRATSLAEPATHLRCTLLTGDAHLACLTSFLARFPRSPRAPATLARLATHRAATDCAAAAPLLADYLARHPDGPAAASVAAWRARCASPR